MMGKKKLTALEYSLFIIPLLVIVLPFLLRVDWTSESNLMRPFAGRRRDSCQTNLKRITLGIAMYAQDNDERMPLTSGGPISWTYGWADSIQPYIKTLQIYQCPSETTSTAVVPNLSGYTDYWYNGKLSSAKGNWNPASSAPKSIRDTATTLMLGEGNDGTDVADARYSKTSLPSTWLSDRSKPAWRHLGGANYAFVDGHVKWLRSNEVLHYSGRANAFSLK